MLFLVTNSYQVKEKQLINGYFIVENNMETEELENVKQLIMKNNLGIKTCSANETRFYCFEEEVEQVELHLATIAQKLGWSIYVITKPSFNIDVGILRDKVFTKDN